MEAKIIRNKLKKCQPYFVEKELLPLMYFKEDKNENIQNPYKKNDTIKESENESESTQKEIVINPCAKMSKENLFSESNQKTDFDSYNNNQNQNSLFGKGK